MRQLLYGYALAAFVAGDIPAMAQRNGTGKPHLRTDGFYFYDNGIDTLAIIPNSKELFTGSMAAIARDYPEVFKHFRKDCAPDSVAVAAEGTARVHAIAFINDTLGTSVGFPRCRDSVSIQEALARLKRRISGCDTDWYYNSAKVHNVHYQDTAHFTFTIGVEQMDREVYTATVVSDSLFIEELFLDRRSKTPYTKRAYCFIPYNNIPARLGRKKE